MISFSAFQQAALDSYFAASERAGRRGDFVTSPELGQLFGTILAKALDTWWVALGEPDPFVVVEAGAGNGNLARAVLSARPSCLPVLHYIAVERSVRLRDQHTDVQSQDAMPASIDTGVIIANELLDNLPVDLYEYTNGEWHELLVDQRAPRSFVRSEESTPISMVTDAGACIPVQTAAREWVEQACGSLRRGRVVAIDFTRTTEEMAALPLPAWLRTYRGHMPGGHPLQNPGEQDITCDVAVDQLPPPTEVMSQAAFLVDHGLDDLRESAARKWRDRAAVGDLDALRAKALVDEASSLVDSNGLGGFTVMQWVIE